MTHNLQHNPQLIYALLHGKELFIRFRLEPRFADLIENIDIASVFVFRVFCRCTVLLTYSQNKTNTTPGTDALSSQNNNK